jgi:CheY-like chemotaxis protein
MSTENTTRILVADDDDGIRLFVSEFLSEQGIDVVTASDGEQAVKAGCTSMFDLCILDIEMPNMDGLKACEILRQTPLTAALPILFLTMSADSSTVNRAFAAGASDFLTKPVIPKLLWHRIQMLLQINALTRETQRLKDALAIIQQ